jgi:hypothetical protein
MAALALMLEPAMAAMARLLVALFLFLSRSPSTILELLLAGVVAAVAVLLAFFLMAKARSFTEVAAGVVAVLLTQPIPLVARQGTPGAAQQTRAQQELFLPPVLAAQVLAVALAAMVAAGGLQALPEVLAVLAVVALEVLVATPFPGTATSPISQLEQDLEEYLEH